MSYFLRKGTVRGYSRFGYSAQLFCVTLLAGLGLGQVQAEPIAQANDLEPTSQAQALLGATGTYSDLTPDLMAQTPAPTTTEEDESQEPVDLLGEFNVTAQRRRTTERENTQTTYIVNREEIRALGATTVSDALRLVPGFTLIETLGGVDLRGSNFLRGLDDARFIILQDGRPLTRASNNRASDISKLSIVNVERIEVVTGGATLRYGADAVAGVINIITRVPEGPPQVSASATFGSFGFAQYTLSYSGSTGPLTTPGNFAYDIGYERRSAINDFLFTSDVQSYNGQDVLVLGAGGSATFSPGGYTFTSKAIQNYVFSDLYFGKVVFKPGQDHTVTVYAQQQNTRRGSLGFGSGSGLVSYYDDIIDPNDPYFGYPRGYSAAVFSTEYYQSIPGIFGDADSQEDDTGLNVTWDWNLSELNTLTTQFSYKHTSSFNPTSGGQRYLNNRTYEAQIRYVAELYRGNTLNAGFQFITNRSVQSPEIGRPSVLLPGTPPGLRLAFDREISRVAVFFTEDLRFFDDALITNFGARTTSDVQFGVYTSLGAGLRYNFGGERGREPFGLRFNYSESFKAPGLSQLYATFTSGRNTALPNPNLEPELGKGFDIGLDIQIGPSALLRATYFRTDVVNAVLEGVQTFNDGIRTESQTINAQATLTNGWEFLFEWQIDPTISFQVNHSILDARPVGNAVDDGLPFFISRGYFYGQQFADVPFNTTNVALRYNSSGFNAALSGVLVGRRPIAATSFIAREFTRFDLTASVPITPAITINGGVFNLLNQQYDAIASFNYPGAPISFRFGVEATF
ncbi:TonB-dependent siderophore receptor [Candidatus Cyanaurora vandensis]|uniref:TonB-dependent receptor plug domain-containing protein n=1 Tax=Candidatus Cyanaurora vandensis TaxID=2714958 RepID=UPI00257C7401|nr:TonB-dependent receptor [Candidatus Cyanaurora vandensis]